MKTHFSVLVSLLLFAALPALIHAEDRIPTGFKLDRYTRLWERNPFTEVKPRAPESNPSPFEKLFLTSWLKDNGKFVIFVQSSDTNEVQRITTEPNQDNLRLVDMHVDSNPAFVEAVISSTRQKGVVKFRFGQPSAEQVSPETAQTGYNRSTSSAPNPGPSQSLLRSAASLGSAQKSGVPASPTVDQTVPHRYIPAQDRVVPPQGRHSSG